MLVMLSPLNELVQSDSPWKGGRPRADGERPWHPSTDLVEKEDGYCLRMDVPGIPQEQIDVTIAGDMLTVRGERPMPRSTYQGYRRLERLYGPFERCFQLPGDVDPEGIRAEAEDGVLLLELPKLASALPRRVRIGTAPPAPTPGLLTAPEEEETTK